MTDLIYTHISARIPGPEHHFLINRYGVLFHEMRASDLVKIDLDGNVLDEEPASRRVKRSKVRGEAVMTCRTSAIHSGASRSSPSRIRA